MNFEPEDPAVAAVRSKWKPSRPHAVFFEGEGGFRIWSAMDADGNVVAEAELKEEFLVKLAVSGYRLWKKIPDFSNFSNVRGFELEEAVP